MEEIIAQIEKRLMKRGGRKKHILSPYELRSLNLELTYQCNARCIICDTWKLYFKDRELDKREITFEDIQGMFVNSQYLKKLSSIILAGAEVLLRKDIVPIAGLIIECCPRASLGILTNGLDASLIDEKVGRIIKEYKPGSFWLGFSLDGIGEIHDRIRGVKGAYEKFLGTVDLVKKKYNRVGLCLNFTITPQNYQELWKVYQLCKKFGINFGCQFVVNWNKNPKFKWSGQEYSEIRTILKEIIQDKIDVYKQRHILNKADQIRDDSLLVIIYYLSQLVDYAENPRRIFEKCLVGTQSVYINPYGQMIFCPLHVQDVQTGRNEKKYVIGNIKDKSFDEIWISDKAQKMRETLSFGNCHCYLLCSIMPILGEILAGGRLKRIWKKCIRAYSSFSDKLKRR